MPMYWIKSEQVAARLRATENWLLGWRRFGPTTNERSFIGIVHPRSGGGDSIFYLRSAQGLIGAASLYGLLTSFVFDSVARQKIGGSNVSFYLAEQLPVVSPAVIEQARALCSGPDGKFSIALRVLELSATADDMSPFSKDLWPEGDGAVFRYDPERRFEIRCELDAAFFHLYLGTPEEWSRTASPELLKALPTPRDAVAYIMETFPIVKRKDEEAHGHYRTKDRILALYDELEHCLASGRPFKSTLNPPPGPPTSPDGTFAKLPAWPAGTPKPASWPAHVHPPVTHRS
jgi:hypothetical protein